MVQALNALPDDADVFAKRERGTKEDFVEECVRLARWSVNGDPDAETIPDFVLELLRREKWPVVLSDVELHARRPSFYGVCSE